MFVIPRTPGLIAACLLLQGLAAGFASAQSPRDQAAGCAITERNFETGRGELGTPQLSALLFAAADNGCVALAPRLIEAGASVGTRDRTGGTALTHAASAGRVPMIRLLLANGADLNQRDINGATPLAVSIEANRTQAAEALLAAGADPSIPGHSGVTPLTAAAYNGNLAMVDLLLRHNADPLAADSTGKPAILYAAARGFTPIVVRLLDSGIDINAVYEHGLTVLSWAAGHADDVPEADAAALVTLLLDRGARTDIADDRGQTPLVIATDMNHSAIIAILEARAKP